MKKLLFFVIAIFLLINTTSAQTPQYYCAGGNSSNTFPFSTNNKQIQWLILNTDFGSLPPTGFITKVYFRASLSASGPSTFSDFEIQMGNTSITSMPSTTYSTGLTTVVPSGSFTTTTTAVAGTSGGSNGWIGFDLATPFYYDNTQNIQIKIQQSSTSNGFYIYHLSTGSGRRIYGDRGNAAGLGLDAYRADFGIDIFAGFPCVDTPKSLVKAPDYVCPNRPFGVSPATFYANATYLWQYSYNGSSWSNHTATLGLYGDIVDSITVPKWYRCKITCNATGKSYTTPPKLVNIAPFYYCYCIQGANTAGGLDIGNVKVIGLAKGDTLLNKGNPLPLTGNVTANKKYTAYQDSVAPVVLYKDSLYRIFVSQITSNASASAGRAMVYIDYDRDGIFDQGTELVMNKAITNPSGWDSIQFKVPPSVEIGLTGLRVVLRNDTLTDPCLNFGEGETEDYLAELRYEPCKGVPEVGKTEGDTTVCFGYDYLVTDTTYERLKSEIKRAWQVSADNVLWFAVPNSTGKDTLMRIFTGQPLYYRMQVVCDATHDTAFSPAMLVNQKAAYKCYCYSQAVGGKFLDSSDIGGFSLAGYANNDGGTHLDNPKATRKRTDHTDEPPIVIDVDSNYNISTFHIMRGAEHADAKITIFMDFNNNHTYDIAAGERVFTGFTSVGSFTLVDKLTVQKLAIMNVPTGMRVILNNDIAPNIPSDEACGPYTSGETEDYMVIFRKSFPTNVNDISGINNVGLYPNPTSGKFTLQFSSSEAVKEVTVTITNVTGQKISEEVYPHTGGQFTRELDLTGRSKGVYFVELQSNGQKVVSKLVVQ